MKSPQIPVVEVPVRDEQVGFDLRVNIRDAKTGREVRHQNYTRISSKDKGVVYIRDGEYYYENGEIAEGYKPVEAKKEPVKK